MARIARIAGESRGAGGTFRKSEQDDLGADDANLVAVDPPANIFRLFGGLVEKPHLISTKS